MQQSIKDRTRQFALSIITLSAAFGTDEASRIIKRQLLRSATAIGANYRAAQRGKSKADFIMKLKIAEEEADETVYWLELARLSGLLYGELAEKAWQEANELTAILTQSVISARRRASS